MRMLNKLHATSDDRLTPSLIRICFRARKKFDGNFLKQDKAIFNHKTVVSIYIVYEINLWR